MKEGGILNYQMPIQLCVAVQGVYKNKNQEEAENDKGVRYDHVMPHAIRLRGLHQASSLALILLNLEKTLTASGILPDSFSVRTKLEARAVNG